MKKPVVFIIGRDKTLRQSLKSILLVRGLLVSDCTDTEIGASLQKEAPNLIVVIHSGEDPSDSLKLLEEIRRQDKSIPLILIANKSSEELAIASLKLGVSDYLKQPLSFQDFLNSVSACLSLNVPATSSSTCTPSSTDLVCADRMIGQSQSILEVKTFIQKVALTDSTVLITGETGTGKELAAELIHLNSPRHKNPFVAVNCVAIPDTLLESELFGHERGAFTGALASKDGMLKAAEGGTVFLDEIGDMTLLAQAKILRAIESREVCRLGGKKRIALDIRIIAATNQNLEQSLAKGNFRNDLYYRLNVARLHLPALRDRQGDIALLADYFISELNHRFKRAVQGFTDEALGLLVNYEWPGNIRELKNLLEATYINLSGHHIGLADLPTPFLERLRESGVSAEDERDRVLSVLAATNWNKSKAAHQLQCSRMTLYRKMEKYQIDAQKPITHLHLVTGDTKRDS